MKLYFAYGSNMAFEAMAKVCPGVQRVGQARLSNYRLRFSRRSIKSHTGVADVVPAEDFCVMGMLYEVPDAEWPALERKEGLRLKPPAYREVAVSVYSFKERREYHASTFVVCAPEANEQIPSSTYLQGMIETLEGSSGFVPYLEFLKWLKRCIESSSPDTFRRGTLVLATTARGNSRGRYLIRANPASLGLPKNTKRVMVEFDGKATVASFDACAEVPDGICEMDQNLRHAFGITGQKCYGQAVMIRSVKRKRVMPALVEPRNLCLTVRQTNWTDSEKRICVLHPKNIVLLGLEEGEHVEIECSTLKNRKVTTKTGRYRVYTSEGRHGQAREYPEINCVYLDRECRDELGLSRTAGSYLNWPVLVRPSVSHLLRRRIAVYGITFLLGIASLSKIFELLLPSMTDVSRGVAAVICAVVATAIVTLVDVRAKIRY
ncbi:gamma-glutamylcyclotransferase [Nocardia sp. NBC_00565]|uniref:gamma-glutamylcyclotransferase family protein n=1 Tax=Nocardia sp. NBC_00565 TaxID=2975993 RepID=UPI002E81325D|nr:gamma-glutamylcyclotransferase family protein [Nocardia sp. NBC_00565]WUC00409.1 gamma-glutamylcyclotransferase [Nocardia sp. NBC_00565]